MTGHAYVTWQDYQRRDTSAGEYSIQLAESTDGGATWSATRTVNPDTGLDHYFPAVDLANKVDAGEKGAATPDRVGASYYRTERVPAESSGATFAPCDEGGSPPTCTGVRAKSSDYVLAGGTNLAVPYAFDLLSPVFAESSINGA